MKHIKLFEELSPYIKDRAFGEAEDRKKNPERFSNNDKSFLDKYIDNEFVIHLRKVKNRFTSDKMDKNESTIRFKISNIRIHSVDLEDTPGGTFRNAPNSISIDFFLTVIDSDNKYDIVNSKFMLRMVINSNKEYGEEYATFLQDMYELKTKRTLLDYIFGIKGDNLVKNSYSVSMDREDLLDFDKMINDIVDEYMQTNKRRDEFRYNKNKMFKKR